MRLPKQLITKWGFVSDIEQEFAPKGLSEDTVRFISAKKNEPEWMLEWRLKAYRAWLEMEEVSWAKLDIPEIDYQDAYYAAPKAKEKLGSLDEVDPEILRVYEKLGIPIEEQKVLAGVEGAAGSPSTLCSTASASRPRSARSWQPRASSSSAFRGDPRASRAGEEVSRLGRSAARRLFRFCLNSAVFSDGTFVYIPEGVRCPNGAVDYFPHQCGEHEPVRAHFDRRRQGQLRRLPRGCTAPMRDENQLHAAVVEIFAHEDAEVKYSTVQNWASAMPRARAASSTS